MPDILILCRDDLSYFDLPALSESIGFRAKVLTDPKLATEWLKMKRFEGILIDATFPIETQQDLGGLLWASNPLAPFIAYDFENSIATRQNEARLFGAELVCGPNAKEFIAQKLNQLFEDSKKRVSKPFRILVVEDLDSPRDIICAFLESLGYKDIKSAASAAEAMRELEQKPQDFECILTDIRMPGINGKEFIAQLRQHPKLKHLPIVVLTAYGTADCLIDCLKAGASGFLVKPPKRSDITRELARAQRILHGQTSARLANTDEAELIRDLLLQKGFS